MTKHEWHTFRPVHLDALVSRDLQAEREPHMYAYLINLAGYAERAEAMYDPTTGRIGIAWGAPAEWADVDSVEHGIDLWSNDPGEWHARN